MGTKLVSLLIFLFILFGCQKEKDADSNSSGISRSCLQGFDTYTRNVLFHDEFVDNRHAWKTLDPNGLTNGTTSGGDSNYVRIDSGLQIIINELLENIEVDQKLSAVTDLNLAQQPTYLGVEIKIDELYIAYYDDVYTKHFIKLNYHGLAVDWIPGPDGTWTAGTNWGMSGRTMHILVMVREKDILAKIDSMPYYPKALYHNWQDTLTVDDIRPMFEVSSTNHADSILFAVTNSGDITDIFPGPGKMIIREVTLYEPIFPCK